MLVVRTLLHAATARFPVRAAVWANNIAFLGVLALVAALGLLAWRQIVATEDARVWVEQTYQALSDIKDIDLTVRMAESGQRGFLLSGEDAYLAPYREARSRVAALQGDLGRLTADNALQQDTLRALAPLIQRKLDELAETIRLRRAGETEAALGIVRSDVGRQIMDRIDAKLATLRAEEDRLLHERLDSADRAAALSKWLALIGSGVALLLLTSAARLLGSARRQLLSSEREQRILAAQLRTSLDSISQGIAVFDPGLSLVRCNPCFPTVLALPPEMIRAGTPYGAIAEHLAEAGAGGEGLLETELQIRHGVLGRAPGEAIIHDRTRISDRRNFELRRTAMPDGGFVLTVSDMTERHQSEAILRESQRLQAFGQLTGGVAHDFNNLLSVIIGNLELMASRLGRESPMLPRIDRIMGAAKRGATLTQQLLAFARKQPLAPQPLNLSAMLPDLAHLLGRTLGEYIDVRVLDAAGLWPAMADAAQLESAIVNLALNARDAMPDGGRLTIEVANKVLDHAYARAHVEVTAGDYVMVAVSDTGTGIPPDVLARVFEPFFTTKEDGKGSGLGLAMVFGFVKQSGGHIKIYSEPGEGTTVRLYLPRASGAEEPAPQRNGTPAVVPTGAATLLIVEDDASVREVAGSLLRDLGYRVHEAHDGAEALRLVENTEVALDLALIDVVLPGGMKGSEVARRLTEARPGLRVLFMSGYTENAIVHHGRLDDGVLLISKPFEREQLAIKVAEALACRTTGGEL